MGLEGRDPLLGRTIAGRYRVLDTIARGSTSTVYRAHHPTIDKSIALKIHDVKYCPASFAARFEREAKLASRLSHPNSVIVLDSGSEGHLLFIAMEYVDGETLSDIIYREAPMNVARMADLMMQVLAALSAAHEAGIIHRDIKPSNIMVTQRRNDDGDQVDFVKVCDFGVAKVASHLDWSA